MEHKQAMFFFYGKPVIFMVTNGHQSHSFTLLDQNGQLVSLIKGGWDSKNYWDIHGKELGIQWLYK